MRGLEPRSHDMVVRACEGGFWHAGGVTCRVFHATAYCNLTSPFSVHVAHVACARTRTALSDRFVPSHMSALRPFRVFLACYVIRKVGLIVSVRVPPPQRSLLSAYRACSCRPEPTYQSLIDSRRGREWSRSPCGPGRQGRPTRRRSGCLRQCARRPTLDAVRNCVGHETRLPFR